MGLCNLFQFLNMMSLLVLSWMLHNVQSVPVSNTEALPVSVKNLVTPTEGPKVKGLMGTDMESQMVPLASTWEKQPTTDVGIIKDHKDLQKNVMVSYVCDAGRGICWLDRNQDSTFSFLVPFPSHVKPSAELRVKDFPVFGYKKSQFLVQSNVNPLIITKEAPSHSESIVLKRGRRDVQSSDLTDNGQQQPVYYEEGGGLSEPEQVQQRDVQKDTSGEQSNGNNNNQPFNSNQNSEEAVPQDNPSLLVYRQQVKRSAQTEDNDTSLASPDPNVSMSSGPEDKNSGQDNSALKQQRRGTLGRAGYARFIPPYQSNIIPFYQPMRRHNRPGGSGGLNYRSPSDTDAGLYYGGQSSDGQSSSQDNVYNPYASPPYQSNGNYYNPSPHQSYQRPYNQLPRQGNYRYRGPMHRVETDARMYYGKKK